MLRPVSRALVRKVGHRGVALLFFALLDGIYAFSLYNPPTTARQSPSLAFIAGVAPLPLWGALWGVAAAACLVSAFMQRDRWGFAATMLVQVLWGALYVYGAVLGIERAYLSATIWLCLAGWVGVIASWPEPPDLTGDYGWEANGSGRR